MLIDSRETPNRFLNYFPRAKMIFVVTNSETTYFLAERLVSKLKKTHKRIIVKYVSLAADILPLDSMKNSSL